MKKLSRWVKGTTAGLALLASSSLFAQTAQAQDNSQEQQDNKPAVVAEAEPRQHEFGVDVFTRGGGNYTPDQHGGFVEGGVSFNIDHLFKPRVYGLWNLSNFEVTDSPDLRANTGRIAFGNGMNIFEGKNEWYIEPQIGFEWNKYEDNFDADHHRTFVGLSTGWRNQDTLVGLNGWYGFGGYDGKLQSGFPVKDDYNDLFIGLNFNHFFGQGDKTNHEYLTDFFDDAEIVNAHGDMWQVFANGYFNTSNFETLLQSNGGGARGGVQYILNMRNYAREEDINGWLLRIGPVVQGDWGSTSSDLSERVTNSEQYRFGAMGNVEYVNGPLALFLALEGGYQLKRIGIDDPGQGINRTDRHDGGYFGATAGISYRFK